MMLAHCIVATDGYSATSQTPYAASKEGGLLDKYSLSGQYYKLSVEEQPGSKET